MHPDGWSPTPKPRWGIFFLSKVVLGMEGDFHHLTRHMLSCWSNIGQSGTQQLGQQSGKGFVSKRY